MKHVLDAGKCKKCRRTGADLKPPCPGYVTAAESGNGMKIRPTAKKGRKK